MEPRSLEVRLGGELVGYLTNLPSDDNLFSFAQEYVESPNRPTLSLSLVADDGQLIDDGGKLFRRHTVAPPFFNNLLPEGALRTLIANRAQVNVNRDFPLLAVVGGDLLGAVTLTPMDGTPDIETSEGTATPETEKLAFAIPGVQLKFSAIRNERGGMTIPVSGRGGDWIAKIASFADQPQVPENEFTTMSFAREIGIDVPEFELIRAGEIENLPTKLPAATTIFVIKRFDRPTPGVRVHIEDFAQVFGELAGDKYETHSYENIATVIRAALPQEDLIMFLRRLTFSSIVGNGDMHIKNWSLIYPDGVQPRLAPGYDYLCSIAYNDRDRLGLSFGNSKDWNVLDERRIDSFSRQAELPGKLVSNVMRETAEQMAAAWPAIREVAPVAPEMLRTIESHMTRFPQLRTILEPRRFAVEEPKLPKPLP